MFVRLSSQRAFRQNLLYSTTVSCKEYMTCKRVHSVDSHFHGICHGAPMFCRAKRPSQLHLLQNILLTWSKYGRWNQLMSLPHHLVQHSTSPRAKDKTERGKSNSQTENSSLYSISSVFVRLSENGESISCRALRWINMGTHFSLSLHAAYQVLIRSLLLIWDKVPVYGSCEQCALPKEVKQATWVLTGTNQAPLNSL